MTVGANAHDKFIECRAGCGACCIALSISSSIPGMPAGKPAGVRCVQLGDDNRCQIFGQPGRPQVCSDFQAERQFCGDTREQALELMRWLEQATRSDGAVR
ncbi:MAG: YkgJ family cysteine cluster protein [Spongiibacteraceae bacterium]